MVESRRHVPIDAADIVAVLIFADLGELHPPSFEDGVVFAGEDLIDQTTGLDLDLADFFEKVSGVHRAMIVKS
jgi:hypothetical protein